MVRPRQFTDEQILESARASLLEHGPAVSTSAIAKAVGMSQAALFKRFGSKEELIIAALMPPRIPEWVGMVTRGPDERDIREQLLEIAAAIQGFFETHGPAMAILRASKISEQQVFARFDGPPPPVVSRRAVAEWFRRARDAGRIRDIDPDSVALMLLGSLIARMFFNHIFGERFSPASDVSSGPDYVATVVESLWRGIAPEP